MWRSLLVSVPFFLSGMLCAQDWKYASVKWHKQSGVLKRFKLVSASDSYPFYVVSSNRDNPRVDVYDWMSENGGTLRAIRTDGPEVDSLALIDGQRTWIARKEEAAWYLPDQSLRIIFQEEHGHEAWYLEKIIDPVPGSQIAPKPVLLIEITRHKRKTRFHIHVTDNLGSISETALQLGIVIALVIEGFPLQE